MYSAKKHPLWDYIIEKEYYYRVNTKETKDMKVN